MTAIEIRDLASGELVDRNPVSSSQSEHLEFEREVARCEQLRSCDADFEPVVVSLKYYDLELDRKEIA